MATPLVELDRPEQGNRLFKLRIIGGEKTLAPFGEAIGFKAKDASGSVSRIESGERRLTDEKAKAAAFYLAGRGDLVDDPWVLYRFLLGFPNVSLRDCVRDGGVGSADGHQHMGGSTAASSLLRSDRAA